MGLFGYRLTLLAYAVTNRVSASSPKSGTSIIFSYGLTDADVNVFGPLARTVNDLELLFDVVNGPRQDAANGWSLDLPLARGDAKGLRVASWLDDPDCPVSEDVSVVLEAAVSAIEADGVAVDRSSDQTSRLMMCAGWVNH